jgi:DNA replication and repair protein RecF
MITNLRLQNFRSYTEDSFEFEPGVNIVVGPNASGKTNLLEAVLVLCQGGSFRARDIELVKFEAPWARLDGFFSKHVRTLKLEKLGVGVDKTFILDDQPRKRLTQDKMVPVVYFEPNHLQLIIRGPDQRRDYFDELMSRHTVGFKSTLASYKRSLAQRNTLLKKGSGYGHNQLFAWNVRLSELGEAIAQARQSLVDSINQDLGRTYSKIAKRKSSAVVEYQHQFKPENYASKLLHKLEASSSLDYARGFTAYGPHREDFIFHLDDQMASSTASRGENRSLMLALKIFEVEQAQTTSGQEPILLLDDVFSELDASRRRALVDFLKSRQAIITTTDADAVTGYFAKGTQRLISL